LSFYPPINNSYNEIGIAGSVSETGTRFALNMIEHIKAQREGENMNFIFGYQREVQVKIRKETSKLFLLAIGVLIVILFLFITFDNMYEENNTPEYPFQANTSVIHGKTLHILDLPEMIICTYRSGL
jgi:hypothetical protein